MVIQMPPLPRQSAILPYTDPPHNPSNGRFVVLNGVDSETTEAEIVAHLRKPIAPDPKFSSCGVLVRVCARLPIIPGDDCAAFVVECESEQDAALVCCVLDGRSMGDNIAGAHLASNDLVQTVKLQTCDHPSSVITSHPPSSLQRQSLSRPSKLLPQSQLGKGHPSNLLHHQSYRHLVSDHDLSIHSQDTLSSLPHPRWRRQMKSAAVINNATVINNPAARLRIAR